MIPCGSNEQPVALKAKSAEAGSEFCTLNNAPPAEFIVQPAAMTPLSGSGSLCGTDGTNSLRGQGIRWHKIPLHAVVGCVPQCKRVLVKEQYFHFAREQIVREMQLTGWWRVVRGRSVR